VSPDKTFREIIIDFKTTSANGEPARKVDYFQARFASARPVE
jgi:hypothetical protein